MNPHMDDLNDDLDRATADRLARLRSMPVDTSRLDRRLRGVLPVGTPRRVLVMRLTRIAVAAVILLAAAGGAIYFTSGGAVMASAAQMAQFHQDMVSGRTPVMQANTIDDAARMLGSQWSGGPGLPAAPQSHVMACCMKSIKNKKVACVLLRSEGAAITMSVASAQDMREPDSPTVTRAGVAYHVQSVGSLNMISGQRQGRWVCLMGEVPVERLMDLAEQLRF